MNNATKPRQRRRAVLSCVECRKRRQKCDRQSPCMQCVARGTGTTCTYQKYTKHLPAIEPSKPVVRNTPITASSATTPTLGGDHDSSALLHQAQEYGYSDASSLNTIGLLRKVITDIDDELSTKSYQSAPTHIHSSLKSEYYGYVRRLPPRPHCELLFQHYFANINHINAGVDEVFFREQLERWWSIAYEVLLNNGPGKIPEDIRWFPALIFQILAVTLQAVPASYNPKIDELKFGPSQTFEQLSLEYTECGVAMSMLLSRSKLTLVSLQHGFMRVWWMVNAGDLMRGWETSGGVIKDAMALGLHLDTEIPSSSNPGELLDALWMKEYRKRIWVNIFKWDSAISLALGRPMYIDPKVYKVAAPIDCDIPPDRLTRVPVPRSESDKPTLVTERILRLPMLLRHHEIRDLELEGPIPKSPGKVRELHQFALEYREKLPPFFRMTNPDTRWDAECSYVPSQRESISHMINYFFMALHRPYIFTREASQRQVYESSLDILDSQDRLFNLMRSSNTMFYIASTFPTFDAALVLAVVLVSNPERYQSDFARPYQSLANALERLRIIGSSMKLARNGASILETTLRRVVEAQERIGLRVDSIHTTTPFEASINPYFETKGQANQGEQERHDAHSDSMPPPSSSDSSPWQFELDDLAMEWTAQYLELPDFSLSNLEVPMPLMDLFYDEQMTQYVDDNT